MSDPIPSATADPDAVDQSLPANAEDRKAAAALSSLNTTELASDAGPAKGRSNAEQEALGKAMSRLEIASGQGSGTNKSAAPAKKETEVKKTVKIVAADVAFLVSILYFLFVVKRGTYLRLSWFICSCTLYLIGRSIGRT